jgi:DNA mismatch endonuclease (patch repair protein)
MDRISPEHRSWNMSRIRNKDTKPEIIVRSLLHRLGLRFTVNGPKNKELPGKPDIVLPKYKTVIFVHGCFWHGHKNCKDFRIPKTRSEWWGEKLEGNVARDRKKQVELKKLGWKMKVIWTCQLKTRSKAEKVGATINRWFVQT